MQFAGHEVTAWLDRGPTHQLFRRKVGGLLYRFYPTMTPELRRRRHDRIRRLTNSLALRLGATPDDGTLVIGDDGEVVWTCPEVSGGALSALGLPVAPNVAFSITLMMLEGLRAYHERDLYHGALTAKRVLMAQDASLVLMDFGAAYLSESDRDERLTPSVHGFASLYPTPQLVPPEIFHLAPLSPASDVFIAAALCYRMLTGRFSHTGQRVMDIYAALRDGRHERFPADLVDGDAELLASLNAALAPNPLDRPSLRRLIACLTPFGGMDPKELVRFTGLPRPYGAQYEPLAPEDAPGPPGSLAEKRRQEILKRATLQLAVMERQRREGVDDRARWARTGRGLGPSWWVAGAIVVGLMVVLPNLRQPAHEAAPRMQPPPADRPSALPTDTDDVVPKATGEPGEPPGLKRTEKMVPAKTVPGGRQLRRRQLELERRYPKILNVYRPPKTGRR